MTNTCFFCPFRVFILIDLQLEGNIALFKKAVIVEKERPRIPKSIIEEHKPLADLLEASWAPDPADRPTFVELITRIDNLLVDTAMKDVTAREFWKKHYITKVESIFKSYKVPI